MPFNLLCRASRTWMTTSGPAVGKGRYPRDSWRDLFWVAEKGNLNDEDCMNMIIHDEWWWRWSWSWSWSWSWRWWSWISLMHLEFDVFCWQNGCLVCCIYIFTLDIHSGLHVFCMYIIPKCSCTIIYIQSCIVHVWDRYIWSEWSLKVPLFYWS